MTITKVLMIDDEPDIRQIGRMSLKGVGRWQVILAESGAEGIAAASRETPDVILLDVMMPGLDGPSTLSRLQEQETTKRIPVIFMTARSQQQEIDRFLSLGAAGVITKPFDPMTLPGEIQRIIDVRG